MVSYNIDTAVELLPYTFMAILGITFVVLEIRTLRGIVMERPPRETEAGGFLRPPEGYSYLVSRGVRCFIRPKGKGLYRVYHLEGTPPAAALKRDRYGRYFSLRAASAVAAESIIDTTYRGGN